MHFGHCPGVNKRQGNLGNERVQQKVVFTSKERGAETGLDYFGARYYSGAQGRLDRAQNAPQQNQQITRAGNHGDSGERARKPSATAEKWLTCHPERIAASGNLWVDRGERIFDDGVRHV